eukprot:TRINITY_DN1464_c0_g1_i6.p1 TRINITY_DN1464_c0_g1~~TRINITY_DN1464_c0_g1_i6.p1  ORF type:complete len:535 (-),score=90.86 TRINITY_DN1464_c0_g1_i6:595-2199(-)
MAGQPLPIVMVEEKFEKREKGEEEREETEVSVHVVEAKALSHGCGHDGGDGPCPVPVHPDVLRATYLDYEQKARHLKINFFQYLELTGMGKMGLVCPHARHRKQVEDREPTEEGYPQPSMALAPGPMRVITPSVAIQGQVPLKTLLLDFSDRPATEPLSRYEDFLFSKGKLPGGSLLEYYEVASCGKVTIENAGIHGWIRMPRTLGYYTNRQSALGSTFPRNGQGFALDAVRAALAQGVIFKSDLDVNGDGIVDGLLLVHAGPGGETQRGAAQQNNIWSHKWQIPVPVDVGRGTRISTYLTVPEDGTLGVLAHELGHLLFQWDDFYDPNYDEDGKYWDGSGNWDLMASGSYNGNADYPSLPAAIHCMQHNWTSDQEIITTTRGVVIKPRTPQVSQAIRVISPTYTRSQSLILENRSTNGGTLYCGRGPGEGLLVWKVDTSKEQDAPDNPALALVEADGRRDLFTVTMMNNAGDASDPFPGTRSVTTVGDFGPSSTTFPGARNPSGVVLQNIVQNNSTGDITLDILINFNGTARL